MAAHTRVLVVDDDATLANMLCMLLENDGYETICAEDGAEGLRLARQHEPEVVILDIMMPGMGGYEVCRRLRDETNAIIIFVTGKGETQDVVRSLQMGGNDYLVMPYTYEELSSRIMACMRRRGPHGFRADREDSCDPMEVTDPDRRMVAIDGVEAQLNPSEFEVLRYLIKNEGKVLSADAILANAWGPEYIGERDLVKQFIYRLRNKLEPDPKEPRYILTVRGSGYVLEADEMHDLAS